MRTTARVLTVLLILPTVALTGCSSASTSGPGAGHSITVGAQSGTSNQVVAHLYGEALAEQGFAVDYNYGIGSRKAFLADLTDGYVDIVPDFAGALLDDVDTAATASSTEDVMAQLPTALKSLGLTVTAASNADKSRTYVTTKEFAEQHALTSIGDLAPIASAITIGSAEDLNSGAHGAEALSFTYGVSGWLFREADNDEAVLDDLDDGNIQVADISTLNLAELDDGLVALSDPKHIVVAQNVVPLVNRAVITPALRTALDAVSAQLTTDDLSAFATTGDQLPATVASGWLKRHGVVTN